MVGDSPLDFCFTGDDFDPRRTREFYRYFEPLIALSTVRPTWVDLYDEEARGAHCPIPGPDKTLSALCQLVTLKLNVARAMLMFFDAENGYVIAEATPSFSLQHGMPRTADESLWLGYATIPKGCAVCEHTINLSGSNLGSNANLPSATRVHIVSDLLQDSRFGTRSFVTEGPRGRFYAGVPLTTPQGISIGALCVLDPVTRDGLDDESIAFMEDVASTIMDHMDGLRVRAEHQRGTNMTAGLSAFTHMMTPLVGREAGDLGIGSSDEMNSAPHSELADDPVPSTELHGGTALTLAETVVEFQRRVSSEASKELRNLDSTSTPRAQGAIDHGASDNEERKPFRVAANIIRNALDVDGVLYLDAAVVHFAGLVDNPDSTIASESDNLLDPKAGGGGAVADSVPCRTLGASYSGSGRGPTGNVTQRFLRSLLRKHRRGQIWAFGGDGKLLPAARDSEDHSVSSSQSDNGGETTADTSDQSPGRSKLHQRTRRRMRDGETIQNFFPGVRTLILVPVWDYMAGRWRAGTFLFSYSPNRVFSEGDVNYVSTFCDVLMAAVARNEAETTLKAKTAFMSSITHELRTPLHGILGNVEHLREQSLSPIVADMITQIDICGNTLLGVVDHLLDFSETLGGTLNTEQSIVAADNPHGRDSPPKHSLTDVALDEATEQAVITAVQSFHSAYHGTNRDKQHVPTILDIDYAATKDWNCPLHAGAWSRICINLVDNALKFTENGRVIVSLQQKIPSSSSSTSRNKSGRTYALLRVQDTGKGMSKSFLANSLFTAFMQEDSFSRGAGLGMSVVSRIVRAIGGQIDVRSEPGKGTIVTVTVPLDLNPPSPAETLHMGPSAASYVTVLSPEGWNDQGNAEMKRDRKLRLSNVRKYAEGALTSDRLCRLGDHGDEDIQVHIVLDVDVPFLLASIAHTGSYDRDHSVTATLGAPLVVLRQNPHISEPELERLAQGPTPLFQGCVAYLTEPCGLYRLSEVVHSCLASLKTEVRHVGAAKKSTAVHRRPIFDRALSSDWSTMSLRDSSSSTLALHHAPSRSRANRTAITDTTTSHAKEDVSKPDQSHSDKEAPKPNSAPNPGATQPTEARRLSVLIVDDNHINIKLLEMYCKKNQFESATATDGLQAVELYQAASAASVGSGGLPDDLNRPAQTRPHVVLMDINMPIMDGLEATRRIRKLEKNQNLQPPALIIAMTGLGSQGVRHEALINGIDVFFQKPVKLRELTKLLDQRFPS